MFIDNHWVNKMPLLMSTNTFYLLSLRQISINTGSTSLISSEGDWSTLHWHYETNCTQKLLSYLTKSEWNCFSFWSSSQLPFSPPTFLPYFCISHLILLSRQIPDSADVFIHVQAFRYKQFKKSKVHTKYSYLHLHYV